MTSAKDTREILSIDFFTWKFTWKSIYASLHFYIVFHFYNSYMKQNFSWIMPTKARAEQ